MEENIEKILDQKLFEILKDNIEIPTSIRQTISTFEYTEKRSNIIYKKVAIIFSFLLIIMNITIFAYTTISNYKAKSVIGFVNDELEKVANNGYIENVDMDYLYSQKIGAKINYIIMSDYNLNILFDFDISETKNVKREINIQDLLIYDENYNIIFCYNDNVYKNFCKKHNIEFIDNFTKRQTTNGYGIQLIELTEENNKTLYTLRSIQGFPKSKKLYIEFHNLYLDYENNTQVKGNWNFELNLNDMFYNRETLEYVLKEDSPITLITANATTTTMRITYKINNVDISKIQNIKMYIKDEFERIYEVNTIEDSITTYNNTISATFPITNKMNLKEMTLFISLNNNDYIPINLVLKNN